MKLKRDDISQKNIWIMIVGGYYHSSNNNNIKK